MSVQTVGIGIIGFGTVGQGVVRLLASEAERYEQRTGKRLEIKSVLVRDLSRQREVALPAGVLTDDVDTFFNTPNIDVVIEVAGGLDPVFDYTIRALKQGKHIVTANKYLLANRGAEIHTVARENNVSVSFEASCGGGIPLLQALKFGLGANQIEALYGILNGTCNYILTKMSREGTSYDQALKEAQEAGFAEADPTFDVNGADTAQKLAIIASLGFGITATEDDVAFEGIDHVDLTDIFYGQELGYTMKLLAIAKKVDDTYALNVYPCFIHHNDLLAQVQDSFNAMSVFGHAVGHTLYFGRGAGEMPTASAVVGDLLNVVTGWYPQAYQTCAIWPDQQEKATLIDPATLKTRFYLRVMVKNEPGVMAKLTAILAKYMISISAILQHEHEVDGFVPVVISTDKAPQGNVHAAVQDLTKLDILSGDPICIRIVDFPEG